jgi:hypothetical protein
VVAGLGRVDAGTGWEGGRRWPMVVVAAASGGRTRYDLRVRTLEESVKITLEIGERVRCDILAWSGIDFGGKRSILRVFPTGSRKGQLDSDELRSMVIRAHHGTRVILSTRSSGPIEDAPWRCVRVTEGFSIPSEEARGMPGVRLPHLDRIDKPSALRTNQQLASSYPLVEHFDEGEGWTFGTTGIPALEGHVRRIIIEKDDGPRVRKVGEAERMARLLLSRVRELAPAALAELTELAASDLGSDDGAALRRWIERDERR